MTSLNKCRYYDSSIYNSCEANKSNSRPMIGIISSISAKDNTQFVYRSYMHAIQDAGGIPVLLSIDPPDDTLNDLFSRIDGLLIAGGTDIDPCHYGQEPIPEMGEIMPERDEIEIKAVRLFMEQNKPILGICRGIQAIAVALGGTLYQDLPVQKPSEINHKPATYDIDVPFAHTVIVQKGSILDNISDTGEWYVNSYHHQAVDRLPDGALLSALSTDGVIEAFEMPGSTFCLGVQWHPERLYEQDEKEYSIFRAFIESSHTRMISQGY